MPFLPSSLSTHAALRVLERFKIQRNDLLHILNSNLGKRIGATHHSKRVHRLLWSPPDNQLLVAIQDVTDGTVVTVLTIDMYLNNYPGNITKPRVTTVINQMVHAGLAPPSLWSKGAVDDFVTAYARIAGAGAHVSLGRWRGDVDSVDLSLLGRDSQFWSWVAARVHEKGYPVSSIEQVTAKFSGGDIQIVPYGC